ncbi:hypothetical protein SDC9_131952 [bioreactor metagenome]|uniref:Uncharacterized protein n=1 Tax=bioreactor metagenome TaxID=1076179 RepID=A0A645D685_9ZZZZ
MNRRTCRVVLVGPGAGCHALEDGRSLRGCLAAVQGVNLDPFIPVGPVVGEGFGCDPPHRFVGGAPEGERGASRGHRDGERAHGDVAGTVTGGMAAPQRQ